MELQVRCQAKMRDTLSTPEEIRVLAVSTVPELLYRFVAPIAVRLRSMGISFCGASASNDDFGWDLSAFDSVHPVRWSRNPRDLSSICLGARDIRSAVRQSGCDLVHVHSPIASAVSRASLRDSVPIVYTAHGFHFHDGGERGKNLIYRSLERSVSRWTDHLVVMNQEDYVAAHRHQLCEPSRITKMGGVGIDLSDFPRRTSLSRTDAKTRVATELGVSPTEFLALMIARIDENKRQTDAIRAVAKLTGDFKPHLVLVGDGQNEDVQNCQRLAEQLGVTERVHFLGYRTDVAELLTATDAFLLISDREGLPRSIMESLSVGTTVIGTRIRGTSDLLANGAGLIVSPRSPSDIAGALQEAVTFAPSGEQVAKVLSDCGIDQVVSDHLQVYRSVLA